MARKKKRKAATPPPKPAARKKAPRRAAPALSKKKTTTGIGMERALSAFFVRSGMADYGGRDWGRLALLVIGLGVVLYYAFSAGGYFVKERGFGELIILWLIVVGLLFELRVRGKMPSAGILELGIFAGLAAWMLLSVTWSIVPARSLEEFIRALLYISGFGLFYMYMARREWLGWLGHLFVAIVAIVAIDALLGKTFPNVVDHPDLFMSNRINYPITYWNTMALFMCMGFIIGLRVLADRATHLAVRAYYAPVMLLFLVVLWFTVSRAGMLLLAAGICLYLFLAVDRLRAVMQAGLLMVWTGVIVFISYRFLPNMVASVPDDRLKVSEGSKLALAILIFMSIAAASQFVIKRLDGRVTVPRELGRKIGFSIAGATALIMVLAVMGFTFSGGRGGPVSYVRSQLGGIGETEQAVDRPSDRLLSLKSERFQEYGVSLKRFEEQPLTGTGAGSWSVAWLKYRPWDIKVKDGHSWVFESLAELGLVGTALLIGFAAMFFVVSIRDLRFLKGRDRELYGAFFTTAAMFLLHSMIDWDWEMPVVTLVFFFFAGGLLRYGQLSRREADKGKDAPVESNTEKKPGIQRFLGLNAILAAACLLAMVITIVPLIGFTKTQTAVRLTQTQDFTALERQAKSAQSWSLMDAEPIVLEALAKQARGKPVEAETLLLKAAELEPENDSVYRNLTRIYLQLFDAAQKRGDTAAQQDILNKAMVAIQTARALNPLEPKETGDLEIEVRKIGGLF